MTPEELRAAFVAEQEAGRWHPAPGDALHDCAFERAGFRAYKLVAPDGRWSLTLSDIEINHRDPTALLTVHAPGHDAAFADLADEVFRKSIGVNGGSNFNGAVKALDRTLGGGESDWDRRLNYLMAKSRHDVQGRNNGTFVINGPLILSHDEDTWVFEGRIRTGRTMSLFGPGSAGKTTLADGLAVSLCTGSIIVPLWRPTKRYRIGVLDWDEGRTEVEARLYAICNAYEVEIEGYNYKRMARPLVDAADLVGQWVIDQGIEVIFVSPVGRAMRQSERDPSGPIEELYEVLREFNTTNILIDHVRGDSIGGGAEREYGSVRKRDNARGSFSVYAKSEEVGSRVVVLKNKKADALSPRLADQGVRIEYDPPNPRLVKPIYDRINFYEDDADEPAPTQTEGATHLRERIRDALLLGHRDMDELARLLGSKKPTIERVLYRYRGDWFDRLSSGKWEALPAATKGAVLRVLTD